ncbi:portal protein [Leptospira interrogans]|uniref:portal protein n=1 Tax=Leptospira interrogans TaxID=173 RepID=UPI0007741FC8|nr:portal protein [Leptospira interrogans]
MEKKVGRPRGNNYEKNLAIRLKSNTNIQPTKVNEHLIHLAKSFFNQVNSENIEGRKPVYNHDQINQIRDGVLLRPPFRIPVSQLRNASYGTSIISAIHTIRIDELSRYAKLNKKKGLWFRTENEEDEITDEIQEKIKNCSKFFERMGDLTEGWMNRDNFSSVFEMMIRDTLTFDSISFYLVYNSLGKLVEIKYLDPATIFQVDKEKGYKGDRSISFVQIIDDRVVEVFNENEILLLHKNHISDVSMRGFGLSPLEACILDLVGVIRSLKFNRDTFTRQHPPGFMSLIGDATQEVIESIQLQYREMISGMDDSHTIPILGTSAGEIKWTPLNIANDMTFKELMQWCVSFVIMSHGMDQSELGLRLTGSAALGEANQVEKSKFSLNRSCISLLTYFEMGFNKIRQIREDDFSGIICEFVGTDPEDEKDKLSKNKDEVSNWKLIDEIRIEQDKPTIAQTLADLYGVSEEEYKMAGAVILNPIFQQNLQMIQQPKQNNQDPNLGYSEIESNEESLEKDPDLVF